jgi:hypothetical protein
MPTKNLLPLAWQKYFDEFSKQLNQGLLHLEVIADELGDQVETDWVPIKGISYNPRTGELDIFTEHIDHRSQPKSIMVQEIDGYVTAIEITDEADERNILLLKYAA